MEKKQIKRGTDSCAIVLFSSVLLHIIVFFVNLAVGGHNCDELMLAMNAKSLVNNLTDVCGERLPIYFDTWIVGGQSPLPTYLAALSVKLFGYSVFAYRLPMLVVSIAGLFAFYGLIRELTDNKTIIIRSLVFCGFSPWHLFNAAWILDCAFMSHFLVIGVYFLLLAVKRGENILWTSLAMLFFAFTFYSYNAAVLFTPVFLAVLYLCWLRAGKINIWFAVKSVLVMAVFCLPFILYGLVNLDILNDMQFLGLSISKMENYTRSSAMTLLYDAPWGEKLITKATDLVIHFAFLCLPDFPANAATLLTRFQHTNFVGGLFLLFGITHLLKKGERDQQESRNIVTATLLAMVFYVFSVYAYDFSVYYRYFVYSYLLFLPMGYGFYKVTQKLSKQNVNRVLGIFLVISLALFGIQFSKYQKEIHTLADDHTYADSAFECFERVEELGFEKYSVVESRNYFMVAYLYAYYQDDPRFNDYRDVMMYARHVSDRNQLTKDDSIKMIDLEKTDVLEDDCYIFLTLYLDSYTIPDTYTIEQYGAYTLAYLAQ